MGNGRKEFFISLLGAIPKSLRVLSRSGRGNDAVGLVGLGHAYPTHSGGRQGI